MDDGWRRWFIRDGRLRTLWRVLLFVALFLLVLQLSLLLAPWLTTVAVAEDRLSAGLIAQATLLLLAGLLAGWAMLVWVDGERPGALGFRLERRVPRDLVAGLGIGAGAISVVVLLAAVSGGYRYTGEAGTVAGWVVVSATSLAAFALPAAAEEAVFRGYLFRALVEGAGPWVAVGITSVLFAWVHGANPNVTAFGLLNILLAGVLLAVAVLRTGSLWFASAVHLGWNWAMAGPLDLPVSGLSGYDVPLYDLAGGGPVWLTGGPFGPEGGLAGTAAALLALALVVRMTRPGAPLAGHYVRGRIERAEDR